MTLNLAQTLVNFMVGNDTGLPARLRSEEKTLEGLICIRPEYGDWLRDFEMPILIELLNSSDSYFHRSFPGMTTFDSTKRKSLATEIQKHASICPRCIQKIAYDRVWEKQVESTIIQNRDSLRKSAQAGEEPMEDDHHHSGHHTDLVFV
jgi:hypothetical protein